MEEEDLCGDITTCWCLLNDLCLSSLMPSSHSFLNSDEEFVKRVADEGFYLIEKKKGCQDIT